MATEEVTRLGACVFDLKFSSVSNNMHLVLSLTKVPIVSLCTKGPPWVAPRKPPFGGLVLGGVITWRPYGRCGEPSLFRTTPEGSTGLRTVRLHLRMHGGFVWVYVWCLLKVLITWNQAGLRVVTATTEHALRSAGIGYLSLANSLSFQ